MTKKIMTLTTLVVTGLLFTGCTWQKSTSVQLEPELQVSEEEKMMMQSEGESKKIIESADSDAAAIDAALEGTADSYLKADQTTVTPDLTEIK